MKLKFIDLFSGIGGFRLGFEKLGFECVFSCDSDKHAASMYKANFGDNPFCDITSLDTKDIPDFNILLAGFPCQAFSISGKRKGFKDRTRGTLFFDIIRVLEAKKPEVFVLENVAHLEHHDKGNTFRIMMDSLHQLGYTVNYKVLNARDFGLPQNRLRVILVGNKMNKVFNFDKMETNRIDNMLDFLDEENHNMEYLSEEEYTLIPKELVKKQKSGLKFVGYLNKKSRFKGVRPNTQHLSRVHRQPNRIYSVKGIHPTIPSQETSGRFWILTLENRVRKLTIEEVYRFQGFPDNFKRLGPITQQYLRIGNSIPVNMVEEIAKQIKLQFYEDKNLEKDDILVDNPIRFLNNVYTKSIRQDYESQLSDERKNLIDLVVDKEENFKGVFTVLFTSLTYKCLHPEQDVRLHQQSMKGGYSGRTFDTKYVTPFLREKRFLGAMAESGWLTRSLEQPHPYDLNFPGKIRNKNLKSAFLEILNDIEENDIDAKDYLEYLINRSFTVRKSKEVKLLTPIDKESSLAISEIVELIIKHFNYDYKNAGASVLPEVCIYSIYECMMEQIKRFENKKLLPLGSHTSSDLSSGDMGDINVKYNGDFYEIVELKYKKPITYNDVFIAYNKIKDTETQRYYLLSTENIDKSSEEKIYKFVKEVEKLHGCQIIINGIIDSLKYYLRLLDDTDKFLDNYLKNLSDNTEVKTEQKLAWNTIIQSYLESNNIK